MLALHEIRRVYALPQPALDAIVKLENNGWLIRNVYGDDVVNMSKTFSDEEVMVFVTPSGEIKPPRTHGTMLASCELSNLGVSK